MEFVITIGLIIALIVIYHVGYLSGKRDAVKQIHNAFDVPEGYQIVSVKYEMINE